MNALEKLRELKPNEFLSADQVFDALSFAGSLINCNGRESKEALARISHEAGRRGR